jgi:hypothetical protein
MSYRESAAFRASRAKTARKRYWRDPEKGRQRCRDYRERKKAAMHVKNYRRASGRRD